MEEIQLKLQLSCYSLPHSDGRRLQITIQYLKKKTTFPCFQLCYKHVGVWLVMEECCYSLHAPPPCLLFPISENSTSIHLVSQHGNHCLFASLSLSSPTQSPINFPPHLSHHHQPITFHLMNLLSHLLIELTPTLTILYSIFSYSHSHLQKKKKT